MGDVEGIQLAADQLEGVVPCDRLVVGRAGAQHHGMRQAAGFAEPIVGLPAQLCNGPLAKKIRRDALECSFFGNSFRTVLAEFGDGAVRIGIGPRAAGTIESCKLIQVAQELGSAHDTGLSDRMLAAHW